MCGWIRSHLDQIMASGKFGPKKENTVCKLAAILSQSPWVDNMSFHTIKRIQACGLWYTYLYWSCQWWLILLDTLNDENKLSINDNDRNKMLIILKMERMFTSADYVYISWYIKRCQPCFRSSHQISFPKSSWALSIIIPFLTYILLWIIVS